MLNTVADYKYVFSYDLLTYLFKLTHELCHKDNIEGICNRGLLFKMLELVSLNWRVEYIKFYVGMLWIFLQEFLSWTTVENVMKLHMNFAY